jgi:phosphoserine phosphatase
MSPPFLTLEQLKERLAPLCEKHPGGAVVFDADGTLWSHDVGCMVYDAAVEQGIFSEGARLALQKEAAVRGVHLSDATANDVARALQTAWYSGNYNEQAAAEMQVWAYVDMTENDFRSFCRSALLSGGHLNTLHAEVLELAAWTRAQGLRSCVVSASPLWVVQEATRDLGFADDDIAAGIPNTALHDGIWTIQPGMAEPLPYGPQKVVAGRALLQGAPWLAALGDSNFDLDMMREAEIGVGIGEKETMVSGLFQMSHAVRLRLTR